MGRGYKSSRASTHDRDSIRSKPRAPPPPKEWDPADSKISAINSYEDVADEVDDFHLQRDKVLLDDSATSGRKGRRGGRDDDEEEEVEGVWGLGSDEEEDEDEEDLEQYATSDEDGEGEDEKISGRRGKAALSDDDDNEDKDDDEEDFEGWGTSKSAYYGGNEEEIETEQDALDEEAEARRIQKKQLAAMEAADFMLDLEEWGASAAPAKTTTTTTTTTTKLTTTTETLPTEIPADLSPEARLSLLKTRHPEFEPLSAEFLELQRIYPVLAAQAERGGEVDVVRYKALAAYLGVLAMYFALLTREEGGSWGGVKEHGVMKGLVRCRELWEQVKGLQEEEEEDVEEKGDVEMVDGAESSEEEDEDEDEEEEEEGEGDEEEEEEEVSPEPVRKQLAKVTLSNEKASGKPLAPRKRVKLDLDIDIPTTKSKPTSKSRPLPKTATDLSDLSALIPTTTTIPKPATKKLTSKPPKPTKTSDFSDPTTLSHADLSEKQSRKSSLRFHAAQLLSKSALRAQAGRHAGGDTDLPRKDKHPERSSLTTVKRDQNLGDDLDLEEPSEQDKSLATQINSNPNSNGEDDLEYYNTLASKSRKAKRAENGAGGEFARFEEEGDQEGKRAIGYTIEKNKGLTPHRKKDVRNPRVKKRKAYEKAKKKLRTVKRVYDGGQKGSYGGEMTGIKKGVVRSLKLK